MTTPAADVEVDADLVASLIEEQHPDLAGPLARAASGWDNVIYRLGDSLCVRLPRRELGERLIRHEQRWLPVLARRVRVPVPEPVRVGVPGPTFGRHWSIVPWFAGRVASTVPPAERAGLAVDLAEFLTDLHLPAPPDAPRNPYRGVPLADRAATVRARLDACVLPEVGVLRARWAELVATPPWQGPPLWLHGDPHPANLLVDDAGRLAAVLDFGDLTSGDPASDLAAAWMVLDADARETFVGHTRVDVDTWRRAEGWALCHGLVLAALTDDPVLAAVGRHTLDQIVAGRPGPGRPRR